MLRGHWGDCTSCLSMGLLCKEGDLCYGGIGWPMLRGNVCYRGNGKVTVLGRTGAHFWGHCAREGTHAMGNRGAVLKGES